MKKPFLHALVAALYIVVLVLIGGAASFIEFKETIMIPMMMLGALVLSVSVMGYLFFAEPLCLFMENRKQEGIAFFLKTVGFFACFVVVFAVVVLLSSIL